VTAGARFWGPAHSLPAVPARRGMRLRRRRPARPGRLRAHAPGGPADPGQDRRLSPAGSRSHGDRAGRCRARASSRSPSRRAGTQSTRRCRPQPDWR